MRVLLIHERFLPDSGGGGEYVAFERARGLIEAGHSVRVLCAGDPEITEYEGVVTRRIGLPRALSGLMLAAAVAEARKADIVHGFTFHAAPLAWAAARLAGRKVVCEQLGLFGPVWREMKPGPGGWLFSFLERMQLRLPFDTHVFLSEASLDLARRLGFRGCGQVIAPGIAQPDGPQGLPVARAEPPVVLYAGKFDRRKGFDRLCGVAAALPHLRFEAVGGTDDAAAPLPPVPSNLKLIVGRGAVYHAALARASILFMPSRAETFGLVIYEAMLAGCSVVSTIPGHFEGAHIEPWDEGKAAAAIASRLADPALLAREAETNRQRAMSLTWKASTAAIEKLYRKLVATGCAAP